MFGRFNKRRFSFWQFTVLMLITVVGSIWIMAYLMPKLMYESLPDIVGSFVGVLLGFVFALVVEYLMKSSDEYNRKQSTLASIKNELEMDYENIKSFNIEDNQVYLIFQTADAYETAVYSGNLTLLEKNTQVKLANLYARAKSASYLADKLIILADKTAPYVDGMRKSLKDKVDYLKKEIPIVVEHLQEQLG